MIRSIYLAATVAAAALIAGCATTSEPPSTVLKAAAKPAWSIKAVPPEMIVDVSPTGDSLRIAGSAGMVLGGGADAVVNARYRGPIREALGDYDAADVFADKIRAGLESATGGQLSEVPPLGSSAGVDSRSDAERLRHERLAKDGYDTLLDLTTTFGIFGSDGTLAVRLTGKLKDLDGGTVWDNTIAVSASPVLADAKLQNPTKRMGYNLANPEFTVNDEAVRAWTADGAAVLKERFESTADAATSALLCDLGIAQDATGEYYLGVLYMNRKDFDEAEFHFNNALQLDPNLVEARNGRAVNMFHDKRLDQAIAEAQSIAAATPEFGPAHYNLAFWLAVKKDDPASARPHYEQARALGMPTSKQIEKALGQ